MPLQICVKTEKSLQELALEMRHLFSLPPFKYNGSAEEPYCQFEMLGMLVLLRQVPEEDRDPEVIGYPYSFDMQFSFTEHNLETDEMEYQLQPYYAQLLVMKLGLETACLEKRRIGQHWQIRYSFYAKNLTWDENILYGEPGWSPAVKISTSGSWRSILPLF